MPDDVTVETGAEEAVETGAPPMSLGEKFELATSKEPGRLSKLMDTSSRKAEYAAKYDTYREDYKPGEEAEEKAEEETPPEPDLSAMSDEELEELEKKLDAPPPEEEEEATEIEPEEEEKPDEAALTPEEQAELQALKSRNASNWLSLDAIPVPTDAQAEEFEQWVAADPKNARRYHELDIRRGVDNGIKMGRALGEVENNPKYEPNRAAILEVFYHNPEVFERPNPITAAVSLLKEQRRYAMQKPDPEAQKKAKEKEAEKRSKLIAKIEKKRAASIESAKKSQRETSKPKVHPKVLEIVGADEESIHKAEAAWRKKWAS